MIYNQKVTAVILVAGTSSRFGEKYNKVFAELNGKPVLSYSLKVFDEHTKIDEIILVINPKEELKIKEFLDDTNIKKQITIVYGGDTRKQSVHNSLKVATGDIVIIQDGARPMILQEYIDICLEEMKDFKGVSIAVKSKDTIKITDQNGVVQHTTPRKDTWVIQTPQCFDKEILLKAHEKYASDESITDDCMLLELEGINVKLKEGKYTNLKVTTKEDIDILESIIVRLITCTYNDWILCNILINSLLCSKNVYIFNNI